MYEEKEKFGNGLGPADRRRQHSLKPKHLQEDWSGPASWRRLRASAEQLEHAVREAPKELVQEVESVFMPQLALVPVVDMPTPQPVVRGPHPVVGSPRPVKRDVTPPARAKISARSAALAPKPAVTRTPAPSKMARPVQSTQRVRPDVMHPKTKPAPGLATRRPAAPSFLQHVAEQQPVVMAPMALFLSKYIMRKVVLVGAGGSASMTYQEPAGEQLVEQLAEVMKKVQAGLTAATTSSVVALSAASRAAAQAAAASAVRTGRVLKPHRRHHQRNGYARAAYKSRRQALGFGFALVLAAVGSVVSVTTLSADHSTTQQAQQVLGAQTQTSNASAADSKPTAAMINSYTVAPDMPRTVDIPAAQVHARIQQTQTALGLPTNKYDTGWDSASANPTADVAGQGAALITGSGNGVFTNLAGMVAGDTLTVTRGDGATLTYEVMRVQVYDVTAPNAVFALTPYENDRPCLNLVATGLHGDSSVLVFAVQQ